LSLVLESTSRGVAIVELFSTFWGVTSSVCI
jgi:hypothetical protein